MRPERHLGHIRRTSPPPAASPYGKPRNKQFEADPSGAPLEERSRSHAPPAQSPARPPAGAAKATAAGAGKSQRARASRSERALTRPLAGRRGAVLVACNPSDPAKRIQQLEDALAKERERSSVARMIRSRRELTRIQCSACRTELRAPVHTTRVGDDIVAAWVQPPADWWVCSSPGMPRHALGQKYPPGYPRSCLPKIKPPKTAGFPVGGVGVEPTTSGL